MKFTVVWLPSALDELARIWMLAPDRKAASNRIDRVLRVDAHKKGHSLSDRRLLLEPPLAVTYAVSLDDRMVQVVQVRWIVT